MTNWTDKGWEDRLAATSNLIDPLNLDNTAPSTCVISDVAAAGTSMVAARRDHVHGFPSTGAPNNTTSAANSSGGASANVSRMNHIHLSPGVFARILANVAIANTETIILSQALASFQNVAGVSMRLRATGTLTTGVTPGSGIFRIRAGTTTLAGVIPATITLAQTASVTAAPFVIEADWTVRTNGASGTILGNMWLAAQNGAAPIAFTIAQAGTVSATAATVTADLTSALKWEFTYISGNAGSTATFRTATMEVTAIA